MWNRYIESYDLEHPKSVIFRILGESWLATTILLLLTVKISQIYGIVIFEEFSPDDEFDAFFEKHWFILGVIIVPLFETIIFQFLVFELCKKIFGSFNVGFWVSIIVFLLIHIPDSIAAGIVAGIPGGFYLALSYRLFRHKGCLRAIAATFILHAMMNLTVEFFEHVENPQNKQKVEQAVGDSRGDQ